MDQHQYDLIVIGGGPAGYVAAIRAAQLGLNVACVDKNEQLGGTCLRVGCIPSKAMLESSHRFEEAKNDLAAHGVDLGSTGPRLDLSRMLARKDKVVATMSNGVGFLFKKNKVARFQGDASFSPEKTVLVKEEGGQSQELRAQHILIATGSRPATLPGVDLDHPRVDTSTLALAYDKPPERLAVIGGGYIGIELGSVWRRLGAQVTIIEYLDRILPGMDAELAAEAHKAFKRQGLTFALNSRVTSVGSEEGEGEAVRVEMEGRDPLVADRCLVAVGRTAHTQKLGLENVGIELDDRGRIPVDEDYKTTVPGVYAVGDVIAGPMLAHKGEEEGVACVEKIVTGRGHVNYAAIPAIVYTHPEIASVGPTEAQLQEQGRALRKGVFSFRANGRAHALGEATGWVKVLADRDTDRVLAVHIIGPRAGDLIAECTVAIEFGASSEDIARTCHAHPTLSEAVKEAALAVDGRQIHS